MSENIKVLTDNEMSSTIASFFKREKGNQIKNQWIDFTGEIYQVVSKTEFICRVNVWLKKHKIPIVVTQFEEIDLEVGGTTWTIEEVKKVNFNV